MKMRRNAKRSRDRAIAAGPALTVPMLSIAVPAAAAQAGEPIVLAQMYRPPQNQQADTNAQTDEEKQPRRDGRRGGQRGMRGMSGQGDQGGQGGSAMMALQQRGAPSEPRPMRELLVSFLDDLSARAEGRTGAVESGLTDLDRITAGGGRPGELWVIGARPSMGKTALTLTLARNVGRQHQVLVLTQEDSLLTLTARHVAAAGGINLTDLRDPRRAEQPGDPDLWRRVQEGVDIVAPLRIDTDDQGGLTVADVRRKMQQTRRARGGLALVVLDYLQLMVGQGDNCNEMLGDVAYGL